MDLKVVVILVRMLFLCRKEQFLELWWIFGMDAME